MEHTAYPAPEAARILVVEDLDSLRSYLVETLGDLRDGVQVHAAADGVEALKAIDLATEPYSLLICDLHMPNMEGGELLTELRRRSYPAAVIMLTADDQDSMIVHCLREGACDYLVKPIAVEVLLMAASNALQHMPKVSTRMAVEYDPHGWFEVSGESDHSVLYRFRRFLGLLDRFKIPDPAASEIRLALEELGRNAIEWGNRNDRSKQVTFGCRIMPGKILVYIEDQGEGFRPSEVPDPSADPLGHLDMRQKAGKRLGGYGIHIIRHMMDKLIYNSKGNRVVAIKYLEPTATRLKALPPVPGPSSV